SAVRYPSPRLRTGNSAEFVNLRARNDLPFITALWDYFFINTFGRSRVFEIGALRLEVTIFSFLCLKKTVITQILPTLIALEDGNSRIVIRLDKQTER
ncbi:hypothetical protein, partial [Parasutterella excrementihominis]|uniref:hypothetical protein n=2 Tax=Parasutterella excrementihominis TaxID=487175 RepID=UPI003AB66127